MMTVRVLYFSTLRDLAGGEAEEIEVAEAGALLGDLLVELRNRHPWLQEWDGKLLFAVNSEYATPDTHVRPGDELALMPPVQGG